MRLLALILGLAGVVPFAGLAGAGWLAPVAWHPALMQALSLYSAVILSFLGGVHWGVALQKTDLAKRHLLWSVSLSVLAWGAVLIPWMIVSLSGFVLLFLLAWRIDRTWLATVGKPLNYVSLRLILTALAALSLMLAIGSYSRIGVL